MKRRGELRSWGAALTADFFMKPRNLEWLESLVASRCFAEWNRLIVTAWRRSRRDKT